VLLDRPGRAVLGNLIENNYEVVLSRISSGGWFRSNELSPMHDGRKRGEVVRMMSKGTIPVIAIVGCSGSGKTTLMEKLIPELQRRGFRVGTIKHHVHESFEIDYPGKDTWRHARAGSECVVLASPSKVAMIRHIEKELSLDEIVAEMHAVDIILAEGYHWVEKPKIEVVRKEHSQELRCNPDELLAIVTDLDFDLDVPCFGLEDVIGLADLIADKYGTSDST
jgi:molybdopterin-guanine dinucleotide biosynthesis protein MobB